MIALLEAMNRDLDIKEITDLSFQKYGRILTLKNIDQINTYFKNLDVPESGNVYIAHDQIFVDIIKDTNMFDNVFGNIPLQYGYCNGMNTKMNAMEYHKTSEINIAVTPMVIIVGLAEDIKDNLYDSSKAEIFYVPKDTVFEMRPNVLHFAPCRVSDNGFKCAVILPKGTNTEFVNANDKNNENQLLFKTNKWLIAHSEAQRLIDSGAHVGIIGKNIEIKY